MTDAADHTQGGLYTTLAESESNASDSSRAEFNPWDFQHTRPSQIANWCLLAIVVAIGLACAIFAPRDVDDLFQVLYRGGVWTAGWPWRFYEEKRGAVGELGHVTLVGYSCHPWAFVADLLVAALLLASLPALRTLEFAQGRFVWSLRDMVVLMCGAGLFFSALPREGFLCIGVIAFGVAPAFLSAPAALVLLASWGWRRLVVRHDAEA